MKQLFHLLLIVCLCLGMTGIASAQDVHQGVVIPSKSKTPPKKQKTEKAVKPDDQERIEAEAMEAELKAQEEARKRAAIQDQLITQGKYVTQGIFFEPGTDRIIPDSSQILGYIGEILYANPTFKVKIIGYPDSIGTDAEKQDLAKRRAEVIKNSLRIDFRIDPARMFTEGKKSLEATDPKDKSKKVVRMTAFLKK